MLELDPDSLFSFCETSHKYISICNNEHFWNQYIKLYKPIEYNMLNSLKSTNTSWKTIYYEARGLNQLLIEYYEDGEDYLDYEIEKLVKNNTLDNLRPYMVDVKVNELVGKELRMIDSIVSYGLKHTNYEILDYINKNITIIDDDEIFDPVANYATPESYKYLKGFKPHTNFFNSMLSAGNLPLFKYVVNNGYSVEQKMLDNSIMNTDIDFTEYLLSFNLDPTIGANYIYNKVLNNNYIGGFEVKPTKRMANFLINKKIYGDYYNVLKNLPHMQFSL
jgi:hypothetical protein